MLAPYQKPPMGARINWAHKLANGLLGCWLLNEGSGNKIYDLSGNRVHGDFVNSPSWWNAGLWASSSNQYVNFGNPIMFRSLPALTVSISVWIRSTNTYQAFVWKGNNFLDHGFLIYLDGSSKLRFGIGTGSATLTPVLDSEPPIKMWHDITGVYDGTNAAIYVNGVFAKSVAKTGIVADSATDLILFSRTGNSADACIRRLFIYSRALSAQEIAKLYQSPYAIFEQAPYWMNYVQAASGLSIPVAMHHYMNH